MKSLFILSVVLMTTYFSAAYAANVPFVGTKYFNFEGGSGTAQNITIAANGYTVIKYCGVARCSLQYKGKFKNLVYVKDDKQYLFFKGNKVYNLDQNKKIRMDCRGDGMACVSDLD